MQKLKPLMTVENTNGMRYFVLCHAGNYTLLENEYGKFVVAWCMTYADDDRITWGQGHYFDDYKTAFDYFGEMFKTLTDED